ncbi:hypothetical protein O181_037927 [Austropuccinia psidii MF-1]|uniref:Uncharacterized protein n=1 Tax=Austropuccinia psidii MF-1 TaxID=1389203 RepID=A0A9Q3DDS2_9BASI|nr:hypothetical protein [Austropuccinia psidii MF-1]
MGDSITEQSDEYKDPREDFLMKYQEETHLEIQEIQLEAGMPQETENKNMCKHTQYAKTFLVTPTKGMEYIHEKDKKLNVSIDNAQNSLIIDSEAHCSIVAEDHIENHFLNWEKQLLQPRKIILKMPQAR